MIQRRKFLTSLLAAPAVIRTPGLLMAVKPVTSPIFYLLDEMPPVWAGPGLSPYAQKAMLDWLLNGKPFPGPTLKLAQHGDVMFKQTIDGSWWKLT